MIDMSWCNHDKALRSTLNSFNQTIFLINSQDKLNDLHILQYKLTYYSAQGLAEPIRYMFAVAGVKYEDNRIPKTETTYPKLPQNIKDETPWGSVPVLKIDGKVKIDKGKEGRKRKRTIGCFLEIPCKAIQIGRG